MPTRAVRALSSNYPLVPVRPAPSLCQRNPNGVAPPIHLTSREGISVMRSLRGYGGRLTAECGADACKDNTSRKQASSAGGWSRSRVGLRRGKRSGG